MKYSVNVKITLEGEIDPKILLAAISPENATMPEGKIYSKIVGNGVETVLSGNLTIGRLMNTIDDVIKTAILAKNVSQD